VSFLRTARGLSNLHLFFRVDAVVFVEGGEHSYGFDEILEDRFNAYSPDIKFWGLMFDVYLPTKKCHYRAVGSKTTLHALAAQIRAGIIRHVIVCMDRDYDNLKGSLPVGAGILHTYGYSWENDVWTRAGVLGTFQQLNMGAANIKAVSKQIDDEFNKFEKACRRGVVACALRAKCGASILHIEALKGGLRFQKNSPAEINLAAMRKILRQGVVKRSVRLPIGTGTAIDALTDCSGHLLELFAFHLLSYLVKNFSGIHTLPKQVAIPIAIGVARQQVVQDPKRNAHYSGQFSAIVW
jgi:hypothetical protein